MFENVIGQETVVRAVAQEIGANEFPRAVLFSGPAYSGKLTAALETARALTCERSAAWTCDCAPCARHRLLLHPDTVLAGPRSNRAERRAARDVLQRTKTAAARFLYLRAARKLARRFDPHVFQAEESRRRAVQAALLSLEELLIPFEPERPLPEGKAGDKLFDEVEAACEKLEGFLPRDNIPIGVIRSISQWANFTSPGSGKIVIIENAPRLLEASRNALLKILEEPPPAVHFILTAERAEELIPTIRSRLRPYRFLPRRPEETREILARVFKEDNPEYGTLKSYFLAWEDIRLDAVRALARRFAEKLLVSEPVVIRQEIPELFQRDAPRDLYRYFLEELASVFRSSLAQGERAPGRGLPPLVRFERWSRLIRDRGREFFTLNISPALFIEGLFLSMKEMP
ncbi:MAG: DNA polymerase III [Spirochaetales bacterium]|nr:DNA polymerase III [Spirochaetales bacterium]